MVTQSGAWYKYVDTETGEEIKFDGSKFYPNFIKYTPSVGSMYINDGIRSRKYYSDKFKYVYDFKSEIESIGKGPGLIISFLPDYYRKNKKKKKWVINDVLLTIYYVDKKTLEQINKIDEYRVVKKKLTESERIKSNRVW